MNAAVRRDALGKSTPSTVLDIRDSASLAHAPKNKKLTSLEMLKVKMESCGKGATKSKSIFSRKQETGTEELGILKCGRDSCTYTYIQYSVI
jgi:hypothetical protein